MRRVVTHKGDARRQGGRCNQQIGIFDGLPPVVQLCLDLREPSHHLTIKAEDRDAIDKGFAFCQVVSRSSRSQGPEIQLAHRDHAHRRVFGGVRLERPRMKKTQ